jgi:lipopolysaccharide biosynthesis glycosyltransferase
LIRIFVGFDPRESVAFSVLSHSLHANASEPVAIVPLMLPALRESYWRERHPLQTTDFSFSRFLTPHLCDFAGWALYMDCDMLARDDIAKLWALRDPRFAVQVVKHAHAPTSGTKLLGPQTSYEKKNWSSVVLFNNAKCTALSPDYVNRASGLELHQFKWLDSDALIGELPKRWNHLVGYDGHDPSAAVVHYTLGGPYFPSCQSCDYADEWFAERDRMLAADEPRKTSAA